LKKSKESGVYHFLCADMRFCFTLAEKILKKEGFSANQHEKRRRINLIPFH